MKSNAKFKITSWDEKTTDDLELPAKLNLGRVTRSHTGAIQGEETMHYTFIYPTKDRSEYVGIGVLTGVVSGCAGVFTVIERGQFIDGSVHVEFDIRAVGLDSDIGIVLGVGRYVTSEAETVEYYFEPAS